MRGLSYQDDDKEGFRDGARFALSRRWGTRAEDPFRGLRAGPVRSSPFFTFADWSTKILHGRQASQNNPNKKNRAEVCLAACDPQRVICGPARRALPEHMAPGGGD